MYLTLQQIFLKHSRYPKCLIFVCFVVFFSHAFRYKLLFLLKNSQFVESNKVCLGILNIILFQKKWCFFRPDFFLLK